MTMLGPGMYSQRTGPCDKCSGTGEMIDEAKRCKKCKGQKTNKDTKVFDIEVPKGAPHGEKIILFGEGDEIPGVEAGDVVVVIDEQPHKVFKRKGGDLMIEKEILLAEALTGVQFTITHLDGKKVQISSEKGSVIKPNSLMTVKDLGMPFFKTSYQSGNLFILFKVVFPDKVDEKLFEQIKKCLPKAPAPSTEATDIKVVMEEYDDSHKNKHSHPDEHDEGEDDEDGHHGGQRV